jgi:hypothetical protein
MFVFKEAILNPLFLDTVEYTTKIFLGTTSFYYEKPKLYQKKLLKLWVFIVAGRNGKGFDFC